MQRILVTGANRGIGLEFTRQLLAAGNRVLAACRNPGRALKLTELAAGYPGRLNVLPLDLARERSIDELAREASALTDRIDVLVNNAGVLAGGERWGELAAKTIGDAVAINAIGPLLLTQRLAPLLGAGARIVNLSSDLGSLERTREFHTPGYALSKAALNMVTRLLAAQLGPGGSVVVSVNPGWVRTDMGGERAPLTTAESVGAMRALIERLGPADNGSFVDYAGATLPW
jgi:NAD(P)-dependent dehydrogenase (short-subunit alcohol dehydrogenase family)